MEGRLAQVQSLQRDPFEVTEWLGFGFDRANIQDRDLWKYGRLRRELDQRIAADPGDHESLVYRGNVRFFQHGAAKAAADDYRAALAVDPGCEVAQENLRLLGERLE